MTVKKENHHPMRHPLRALLLAPLALSLFISAPHVLAAGKKATPAPVVPASVVMEWFNPLHPHAGQSTTIYAQMWIKNKPVRGAHLSAVVLEGTRVLAHLRGSATDRSGKALAHYAVPASLKGKTLSVQVTLTYHGAHYSGKNQLQILK